MSVTLAACVDILFSFTSSRGEEHGRPFALIFEGSGFYILKSCLFEPAGKIVGLEAEPQVIQFVAHPLLGVGGEVGDVQGPAGFQGTVYFSEYSRGVGHIVKYHVGHRSLGFGVSKGQVLQSSQTVLHVLSVSLIATRLGLSDHARGAINADELPILICQRQEKFPGSRAQVHEQLGGGDFLTEFLHMACLSQDSTADLVPTRNHVLEELPGTTASEFQGFQGPGAILWMALGLVGQQFQKADGEILV
jgi:hypothetical protein